MLSILVWPRTSCTARKVLGTGWQRCRAHIQRNLLARERRAINIIAPGKIKVSAGDYGKTRNEFTGVPKPKDEERLFQIAPEHLHGVRRKKLEEFKAKCADDRRCLKAVDRTDSLY